jgi:hypothetical protein
MKRYLISFLLVFLFAASAIGENLNATIKQKLKVEITELRKDISEADKTADKLRDDRVTIEVSLRNMEAWGLEQQNQKDSYYHETLTTREQVAGLAEKITQLKAKAAADLKKYYRLKSLACYFVGVVMVLLYFRFGVTLAASLSAVVGVWAPLITIAGPAGAFGVGYLTVYLLF